MHKIILKEEDILQSNRPLSIKSIPYFDSLTDENSPLESEEFTPFQWQKELNNRTKASPNTPTEEKKTSSHNENSEQTTTENQVNSDSLNSENENENSSSSTENAEDNSETTLKKSEEMAEDILNKAQEKATSITEEAQIEQENILNQAHAEADKILDAVNQEVITLKKTSEEELEEKQKALEKESFEKGYQAGFDEAQSEIKRLTNLLQRVTSDIVEEKSRLLGSIEGELVDLTLMIANKVVKSITSSYKKVVYDNVVAAISKLKIKSDLIVKVHPEDLPTVEKYKASLLEEIQGIENLSFIEDPIVDKGGCIISTDFGTVDARIASQFAEIEEQVRRISPIKEI